MRINSKKQAIELVASRVLTADEVQALSAFIDELYAANQRMASRLAEAGLVVERAE